MLTSHPVVTFLATRDSERAQQFFETKLGLRLMSQDEFAMVFDASGTSLRVQKVAELTPQPFTVLGWNIPDIGATLRGLVERGITFERFGFLEQDSDGVWTAPGGAKVAWFKDPDGNLLSLTQLP